MTEIKQANIQAFDKGIAKFKQRMALVINNRFVRLAQLYVERAIEDWQLCKPALKKDMTGNLITGFAAGVYLDGKLIHVAGATDMGINSVSGQAEYWMVGKREITEWEDRGLYKAQGGDAMFRDFDTGAEVYDVFDYKPSTGNHWQDVPERRYAIDIALSFLNSYKGVPQEGYAIIVCNGAPYASYLREVRELDVLTSLGKELKAGELKKEIKNLFKSMQQ